MPAFFIGPEEKVISDRVSQRSLIEAVLKYTRTERRVVERRGTKKPAPGKRRRCFFPGSASGQADLSRTSARALVRRMVRTGKREGSAAPRRGENACGPPNPHPSIVRFLARREIQPARRFRRADHSQDPSRVNAGSQVSRRSCFHGDNFAVYHCESARFYFEPNVARIQFDGTSALRRY